MQTPGLPGLLLACASSYAGSAMLDIEPSPARLAQSGIHEARRVNHGFENKLEKILEAIRLAPVSSGLQPFETG